MGRKVYKSANKNKCHIHDYIITFIREDDSLVMHLYVDAIDEKRKVRVLWHSEIDAICKDLQDKNLWIEIHSETNLDYILATSELQTN